jgi:hypothetical protein
MTEYGPCEICGNQAEYIPDDWFPGRRCPRCGDFDYDRSLGWRKITSPDEMVRMSGWVNEQNAAGETPVRIRPEMSRRVRRMPMPRLRERANRALSIIARKYPDLVNPTAFIKITEDLKFQGISYSRDQPDAMLLIHILIDDAFFKGLVSNTTNRAVSGVLTPKGLLFAEEFGASKSSAAQAFVAMWFDESLRDAWTNGFDPGIRAAGFHPVRIDNKDYVGGISDEIMAEIRRSRFVVADYTGQRNGVYFEAGFALGLGLTVIPTCRADDVDELGFDIKHLNTLLWNTPTVLAEGLNGRVRAVVGAGPDVPAPC